MPLCKMVTNVGAAIRLAHTVWLLRAYAMDRVMLIVIVYRRVLAILLSCAGAITQIASICLQKRALRLRKVKIIYTTKKIFK